MKKSFKSNKGITLVALVVTIVVLLILAGVSISLVLGQNGLITQAQEAKKKTAEATKNEENEISSMSNYVYNETKILPQTAETKPYYPSNEFKKVEGTDLSNGLVIEDASGNQYVWVEVPMTEEVYKTTKLNVTEFNEEVYGKIEEDLHQYTMAYRKWKNGIEAKAKDEYSEDDSYGWFKNAEEYNAQKYRMLKSVYKNGGFWVGRYEAGLDRFRKAVNNEITKAPMSKEGLYPYVFVTRTQAKKLAEQVNYGEHIGSLMFGVQWDLILAFFHNKGNVQDNEIIGDSNTFGNYINATFTIDRGKYAQFTHLTEWHNYTENWDDIVQDKVKKVQNEYIKGVIFTTGASDRNSVMNIYDIAGNVYEWTLEYSHQEDRCVERAGGTGSDGYGNCASSRTYSKITYSDNDDGFRISIY